MKESCSDSCKRISIYERNSSVELLRIIAMLCIVLSHACCHSGLDKLSILLTFNGFFIQWGTLGNLGVAVFILISGYYLYDQKINTKSVCKLLAQIWFYSISIFVICFFFVGYNYSFVDVLTAFFPVSFAQHWFATDYIILILFSPFFNIAIKSMQKKQIESLLLMIIAWWAISMVTQQKIGFIVNFHAYYLIGAYFKKYPDNFLKNKGMKLASASLAMLFFSTVVLDYLSRFSLYFFSYANNMYLTNSLLILGAAVGMFATAIYSTPYHSKPINTIAGCTFAVYLIHENPAVRVLLWNDLLKISDYNDNPYLFLYIIFCVIAVFAAATIIELIRQKTIANIMTNAVLSGIGKIRGVIRRCLAHLSKITADSSC